MVAGSQTGGSSEESFAGGGATGGGEALAARWRRLTAHFDDFVQVYFKCIFNAHLVYIHICNIYPFFTITVKHFLFYYTI